MGTLVLVRHGESEANRAGCFAASGEVPLTPRGRCQAREAASYLAQLIRPQRVISSAFTRALESARIIAEILNVPVEIVAGLQERDLGSLKGRPWHEHAAWTAADPTFDPQQEWLWRPPGGESHEDVRRRVLPLLESLRHRYPREEVVIVSHGAVMRSIWSHLTGAWINSFVPDNGSMLLLPHDGQNFLSPRVVAGQTGSGSGPGRE